MVRPIFEKLHDMVDSRVFGIRNALRHSCKREILKDSIAREKYLTSTTVWPILEENLTTHATQARIGNAILDEKYFSKGHYSHPQLKLGAQRCIQSNHAETHVSQYGEVHNHETCLIAMVAHPETQQDLTFRVSSSFNDAGWVGEFSQSSEDVGDVSATLLATWRQFLSTSEMGRALESAS